MPDRRSLLVLVLAVLAGCLIGYFDIQPTWDDTGITVAAVVLASAVLAALQPPDAWLIGLGVGVPVFIMNRCSTGSFASLPVLGIALVGAGVGYLVGRGRRPGTPKG